MDKSLNISALLESGQLELYVAGSLSPEEAAEVTHLARKHPEIQAEIEAIEQAFQAYASSYAPTAASPDTLQTALGQIDALQAENASAPAPDTGKTVPFSSPASDQEESTQKRSRGWSRYLVAAVLLISLGVNLWLYFRWQDTRQQLTQVIAQREVLAQERNQMQTSLNQQDDMLAHLSAPQSRTVLLEGLEISPQSQVRVVWNPNSEQVLLKVDALPPPPAGKQYQLWAIIGGSPVSAGVLAPGASIQWMQEVGGEPAAFAITLEPEGGSVNPTLDQMYVIGNLG